MDAYPFDTTGLCTEDIDQFYEAYKALKENFSLEFTGQIDFNLEQFEVFRSYKSVNLRESFVIKQDDNNDCYILFIQTETRAQGKMAASINFGCQVWALAYMKQNFGRVLIRRETLADKIIELVHPVELDFAEDKAFSDTFYVLINDHEKAVRGMNRSFRNAVMDTRDDHFLTEVVEHTLISGNHDPVSIEKTLHLAEFVTRICSHC